MSLPDFDMFLSMLEGVGPEAVFTLRRGLMDAEIDFDAVASMSEREWAKRIALSGRRRGGARRPSPKAFADAAKSLRGLGAAVVWRGAAGYPERLGDGPPWVTVCGAPEALGGLQCAMIGSRETAPPFLDAASRLGRALADAGVAVTSGMARGADMAAHVGAMRGQAGTLVFPAQGLLRVREAEAWIKSGRATFVSLGAPQAPFTAAAAIARNHAMADFCDGLVFVAGGLRGGSRYALRRALELGKPVFCFRARAGMGTPDGNLGLIDSGAAEPLDLDAPAEQWAERVTDRLRITAQTRAKRKASEPAQPALWA